MKGDKGRDTGLAYVFGPFRLVPDECLLLRDGEPVALAPHAFDLLRLLVESTGHLQSSEELIEALWPTTVVEDNSLQWNVSTVRKALGDDSEAPRYIETVRGRGYRFIAPVEVEGGDRTADGETGETGRWRRWPWLSAAGLGAVVIAAAAVMVPWHRFFAGSRAVSTAPKRPSVAVLPFENLSNDQANAYFVAGMQDLILTKLAGIGDLKVISRTSTEKYASHPADLKTIARQLGVSTILEGSVQKQGNVVLIDVQLIDTKTGAHTWAQSYQRTLADVFGVEGDVAGQVALALKAKLSPAETRRLTTELSADPEANDLFLRAEYLANRGFIGRNIGALREAISTYKKAVARAPRFALAWAQLSYNESLLAWLGARNVKVLAAQARADAERALELAPHLAAAHLALGYNDYYGWGDFAGALKAFSEALALRPGDANSIAARGYIERRQGHFDAAIASFHQAFTLDPRNSRLALQMGGSYLAVSRFADAERWFRRALALDPGNLMAKAYNSLAIVWASGDSQAALAAAQGNAPILKLRRVSYLENLRKYAQALALLDTVPDTADNFPIAPKAALEGYFYVRMGDIAHARPLLDKALVESRAQLPQQHGLDLGLTWQVVAQEEILLGRTSDGLNAIARAQAVFDKTGDRYERVSYLVKNAAIYSLAGRADLAVPVLVRALGKPGVGPRYPPVMLWVDPGWDRIRDDPRFQALLKKYAKYKPTSSATVAPASTTANGRN